MSYCAGLIHHFLHTNMPESNKKYDIHFFFHSFEFFGLVVDHFISTYRFDVPFFFLFFYDLFFDLCKIFNLKKKNIFTIGFVCIIFFITFIK